MIRTILRMTVQPGGEAEFERRFADLDVLGAAARGPGDGAPAKRRRRGAAGAPPRRRGGRGGGAGGTGGGGGRGRGRGNAGGGGAPNRVRGPPGRHGLSPDPARSRRPRGYSR